MCTSEGVPLLKGRPRHTHDSCNLLCPSLTRRNECATGAVAADDTSELSYEYTETVLPTVFAGAAEQVSPIRCNDCTGHEKHAA